MQFSARIKIIDLQHHWGVLLIIGMLGGFTLSNGFAQDAQIESLKNPEEALTTRMAQIEVEITNLRTVTAHVLNQLHNIRLALAVLHLRIATQSHFPFNAEVELVRHLGGNTHAGLSGSLAVLGMYSTTGVALVAELRDSFGLILLPKLEPLVAGDADQGWASWVWSWVNWAVIPFDTETPNIRQQILQAATDRLTEDNLSGAVQELERLDGPATAIVGRWIKEAKARLTVDAVSNSLGKIAVALLGATQVPTRPGVR